MLDTTSLLSSLVVLLAALVVHLHLKAFSYWSSRGIKGPLPVPVFGTNFYYLFQNKIKADQQWRKKYGHTYGLYEGYSPMLRTSDNELIKFIYVKNFKSFTDRHNEFINEEVAKNWLFWSEGERWANQRALVSPMFSTARMKTMVCSMSTCVNRFLAHVQEQLGADFSESKLQNGTIIEAKSNQQVLFDKKDISNLTLDIIATNFFGLKLNTHRELQRSEFFIKARNFAKLDLFRFVVWFLIPRQLARWLRFDIFNYPKFAYFDQLTQRLIDARREDQKDSEQRAKRHNDFVQMLLDAKLPDVYEKVFSQEDDREAYYNDQADHKQLEQVQRQHTEGAKYFRSFSDLEIRGHMTFLFLAGFETVATALSGCVYELAHKTKLQEELYQELRSTFDSDHLGAGKKFPKECYSDLLNLRLLDAFVSECLRLYSPILEHNRRSVGSIELPNGLRLSAGVPISTNPFIVQRDADYFERPHELDITRFMPENRHKIKAATFIPFGLGPRHCPGMRFALLEMKLALAKILMSYQISPGPKSIEYPPKFEHNPIFLIPLHTEFKLTPRSAA